MRYPGPRGGFTLVEIMIAVVVVAILAAIALPNVRDYANASRQSSLKEAASDIANGLEADYLRTKGYPTTANSFASAHAELPRVTVSGVEWGVFNTTTDRSGASVQVRSVANPAAVCTLGVGTLASTGFVCTTP